MSSLRSGECFGEMGALSGENRSATMEANGDVVLLAIDVKKIATLPSRRRRSSSRTRSWSFPSGFASAWRTDHGPEPQPPWSRCVPW